MVTKVGPRETLLPRAPRSLTTALQSPIKTKTARYSIGASQIETSPGGQSWYYSLTHLLVLTIVNRLSLKS